MISAASITEAEVSRALGKGVMTSRTLSSCGMRFGRSISRLSLMTLASPGRAEERVLRPDGSVPQTKHELCQRRVVTLPATASEHRRVFESLFGSPFADSRLDTVHETLSHPFRSLRNPCPPEWTTRSWMLIPRCHLPRCRSSAPGFILSADHRIRAHQDCRRDREADRLGGALVDDELELSGLLHRNIRRLGALQDLVYEDGHAPDHTHHARP